MDGPGPSSLTQPRPILFLDADQRNPARGERPAETR